MLTKQESIDDSVVSAGSVDKVPRANVLMYGGTEVSRVHIRYPEVFFTAGLMSLVSERESTHGGHSSDGANHFDLLAPRSIFAPQHTNAVRDIAP